VRSGNPELTSTTGEAEERSGLAGPERAEGFLVVVATSIDSERNGRGLSDLVGGQIAALSAKATVS
jgi:hypothetical protein